MEDKRKHRFGRTSVDVHGDGSMTIRHEHEEGPHKDKVHAVDGLDSLHDSLEDNLNPEDRLEEEIHPGIHAEVVKLAQEKQ